MHLTRHQIITEPSKGLSPTALCGQVMASVGRIGIQPFSPVAWELSDTSVAMKSLGLQSDPFFGQELARDQ